MKFTDFARDELGLTMTDGQRVHSLVAFDGVDPATLEGADRDIARRIFGEADTVPPFARRILLLLLGRMSGKTLVSAAYALFCMVTADVSSCGPGDVPSAVTIAPTKKLAGLSIRAGLELARRSPRLRSRIERETADGFSIRRRDGRIVAFEAYAASRGGAAARGVTILVAILDEAQFFLSDTDGAFAINDRDTYNGIAPRARQVIFISTPWPTPTLMGELLEQNWQAPTTGLAAKASTLLMRDEDQALALVVEAMRAQDPANAAREYDADDTAVGGSGLLFDGNAITAAVDPKRPLAIELAACQARAAGVDLSATRDPSTLAVAGRVGDFVHLLEVEELRPVPGAPLKMSETIATFAKVLARHGCTSFIADGWSREAAREWATANKLTIGHAEEGRAGKVAAYLSLRRLLTEGKISLPAHPRLVAQLRAVTSRPAPGGSLIITSPRRAGSHGDLVSALTLAVHALTQGSGASQLSAPPLNFTSFENASVHDDGGGRYVDGLAPDAYTRGTDHDPTMALLRSLGRI